MMNMTNLTVLEAPFEFSEDLALSLLLRRLIMGQKAWITGSYPLSLLYAFEPNDIDVFCNSEEASKLSNLLEAHSYTWEQGAYEETSRKYLDGARAFKFVHETQPPINLIRSPKFECVQDVWATFDLSCCEIGIVWDEEEEVLCLVGSDKFQQFKTDQVIDVRQPFPGQGEKGLARRVWKYADRGWTLYKTGASNWGVEITTTGYRAANDTGEGWTVEFENLPPLTPKD